MMQFPLAGDMAPKQRGDRLKSPLAYFCQVRFLWRFRRSFLRRLCLLIFAFRRFFNEPITDICIVSAGLRPRLLETSYKDPPTVSSSLLEETGLVNGEMDGKDFWILNRSCVCS